MNLAGLDLAVLIAYFGLMFALGLYFARRNQDTESYFLGGRSFKGWVVGISLVGTSISSITFLAYPGDAFKTAWLRYLPNLMLPVAVVVAAYLFLPFFRQRNATTAYEYLEYRFGPSLRVYGALAFIVAQLVRVSLILYLLSLVLQQVSGLDSTTCIVLAGIIVAAYTVVGGITAVIWTDVIQTLVLLIGGIVCIWVIISELPGGLGQILEIAEQGNKLSFAERSGDSLHTVGWDLSLSKKTATMMLLIGLTTWLTEYSSNQNTVQRFCATVSSREARKAMFICALCSLPIWAFFMFLGTALYAYYQVFPTTVAAEILDGTRKAEEILPFFITNTLPSGLIGLVIAAALAAAMSSLDSSINAISAVGIVDIYRRHIVKDKSEQHYLRVAQGIATFAAVVMILGAITLTKTTTATLQDTATILTSLLGGGLLGIYLIGFFTRLGDALSIWIGIACTLVFTTWTILSARELLPDALVFPFDLYYSGIIGNLLLIVIVTLISILIRKPGLHQHQGLTIWSLDRKQ